MNPSVVSHPVKTRFKFNYRSVFSKVGIYRVCTFINYIEIEHIEKVFIFSSPSITPQMFEMFKIRMFSY